MSSQELTAPVIDGAKVDEEDAVGAAIEAVTELLRKSETAPPISGLSWYLFTDSAGLAAVQITIILEDKPSGDYYSGNELRPVKDLFWDEFYKRGLDRWPFIRFHLKSELEEEDEDEVWANSEDAG